MLGFREGVYADAPGLAAPYFQSGMISGCSCVAAGCGSELAGFGQGRCTIKGQLLSGVSSGTGSSPGALYPPKSRQRRWWGVGCWSCSLACCTGTVWAQSRGIALRKLYGNCEILHYKIALGVYGLCLFPCMVQRLHLSQQKSFPLMGEYPCVNN